MLSSSGVVTITINAKRVKGFSLLNLSTPLTRPIMSGSGYLNPPISQRPNKEFIVGYRGDGHPVIY
jgi:hypothetical protein